MGGGEGGAVTPHNGLLGETPPKRGTFLRLQVYERVSISLVEVYERVVKSVISICNDLKGLQKDFMAIKMSGKCLVL